MPRNNSSRGAVAGRTENTGTTTAMTMFLAAGCRMVAAGSYFAQPLAAGIGRDVGLSPVATGLVVTVSQLGYVLGLLLIAPLGDIIESRRLLLWTLAALSLSLGTAAVAPVGILFLVACLGIGMASIAVQILVTLAAFMSDPERRGQVVGNVTSGLLIGILLAWPLASFVAGHAGWRVLYGADGTVIAGLAVALSSVLPRRPPVPGPNYRMLVTSLGVSGAIRPSCAVARGCRHCFSPVSACSGRAPRWNSPGAIPSAPTKSPYSELVGGTGALIAPLAGRLADRGKGRITSLIGVIAVVAAFISTAFATHVWMLAVAAIAINAGVQANHVISQRAVLSIRPDAASRLNSLYIAIFFLGGAAGSAIAAPLSFTGWTHLGLLGAAIGFFALVIWTTNVRAALPRRSDAGRAKFGGRRIEATIY